MKTKVLNMKNFFRIIKSTENDITYTLKKPSIILLQNIYISWLESLCIKTSKHLPIFLNKHVSNIKISNELPPYGSIICKAPEYNENSILEYNVCDKSPKNKSNLQFNLVVPQEDIMQYFIQWQRYRKYWWSSITTTPSLFNISDIKYAKSTAHVNIIAQFPWDKEPVETIKIDSKQTLLNLDNTSTLVSVISLEDALLTLLLDGLNNNTNEEYLRLHRKMAPYKISYAINCKDYNQKLKLKKFAKLLHYELKTKGLSTWLPDFTLPLDFQIKENLRLGVIYTSILSENTVSNGIFHLLNGSTMLNELMHVEDFESYATLLCKKV